MRLFALAASALLAAPAIAAPATSQRAFDPRSYQGQFVGEPTQVLVLGSPHLSGTPDTWDPAVLEPLLARLAAFHPTAITIEGLSGEALSMLWQYRAVYTDAATTYGGRLLMMSASGSAETGLDMPQAEAEAAHQLATWPAAPTPAQRRHLAALFATAGDPNSALVQWWRLDPAERRAEDGINAALMAQLNEYDHRRNENHLIGARLAARLGLERLYPIDDHADDDVMNAEQIGDLTAFMTEPWLAALMTDPRFTPLREAAKHLASTDETLATYRMLNGPAIGRLDADSQWLNMINRVSIHQIGRVRVGAWETRNLRMAANIREVTSGIPGGRVLVIVGSAHKPWLDAYLGMMTDVRIVDAEAVLR